jgi:hypothetical protein
LQAFKRRFFALRGKQLIYFASPEDPTPKGSIDLRAVRETVTGTPHSDRVRACVVSLKIIIVSIECLYIFEREK